ncbi:hypothetical protein SAMN04488082_101265 [Desulfomicrobium apsheronum]|uniref:Uncharacterized protein n=1 Tax=Desulfomicrobium apsheronum TaxID=52560 RepID=A0A1I3NEU7_9BACT|nr:hypothetical protein [Desulfomicrobium apsheronum]SFJ07803.1 hypothetical protein SAMN04488082_101265 [Desulfomicrobium apsheronum]
MHNDSHHTSRQDAAVTPSQRFVKILKISSVVVIALYAFGRWARAEHGKLLFGHDPVTTAFGADIQFTMDAVMTICVNLIKLMTDGAFRSGMLESLLKEAPLMWGFAACLASLVIVGALGVLIWGHRNSFLDRSYFRVLDLLLTTGAVCALAGYFCLMSFETEIFDIKAVLQPVKAEVLAESMQSKAADFRKMENRVHLLQRLLANPSNMAEHMTHRPWFRHDADEDQEGPRAQVLTLAILLATLVVGAFLLIHRQALSCRKDDNDLLNRLGRIVWVLIITSQIFMLSTLYGKLGRSLIFPVVSLRLDSSEATPTHPVFLLAEDESHLIIYDRLNFFQIRHVPKTRLVSIGVLFQDTPFRNRSHTLDEFTPGEAVGLRNGQVSNL